MLPALRSALTAGRDPLNCQHRVPIANNDTTSKGGSTVPVVVQTTRSHKRKNAIGFHQRPSMFHTSRNPHFHNKEIQTREPREHETPEPHNNPMSPDSPLMPRALLADRARRVEWGSCTLPGDAFVCACLFPPRYRTSYRPIPSHICLFRPRSLFESPSFSSHTTTTVTPHQ